MTELDKRTALQYEFIELVLAYEGLLTSQRLREQFDVSAVQASRILAGYRDNCPENIVTTRGDGRGRYEPGQRFKPRFALLDLSRYFELCTGGGNGSPIDRVVFDFTNIEPKLFRLLNNAIQTDKAVDVLYHSMSHPEGVRRVLHPAKFVAAGRRLHLRAYDESTDDHRDFNLARIDEAIVVEKSCPTPYDAAWEQMILLQLRPHPKLNEAQARVIRNELFHGAAGRQLTIREALRLYVLRELEVATNVEEQKPPEYQIYLHSESKVTLRDK